MFLSISAWIPTLLLFNIEYRFAILLFPTCYIYISVSGENLLLQEAESEPPHKVDENMWKNREQIEEIISLLEVHHWPTAVSYDFPGPFM